MIPQPVLASALSLCAPLAQGQYPIMGCVKVMMGGGSLQITASNLTASLRLTLPIASVDKHEFCVPADKLHAVVRACTQDVYLVLTMEDLFVSQEGRKGTTKLITLPARDYPDVEGQQQERQLEMKLPVADLLHGLAQVRHAVAVQDVRYYLLGMLMEVSEGTLHLVATDGQRLSACELCKAYPDGKWILPTATVDLMRKLGAMSAHGSDATLTCTEGSVVMELVTQSGIHARLHSKLIAGNFPQWRRVIPSHEQKVVVDKAALIGSIRQLTAISEKKTDAIALKLQEDNRLMLHRVDASNNEATAELDILDGECVPMTIGINAMYLFEALGTLSGDRVAIDYRDSNSAIVIREDTSTHLIMPVRL